MSLTERQIRLVQASFARLVPEADSVAEIFYMRLLVLAPEIRWPQPPAAIGRGHSFVSVLEALVGALDNPCALAQVCADLAQRSAEREIEPRHYPLIGSVLIEVLHDGLGADFTPEVRHAWLKAYAQILDAMIEAVHPARAA